MNALFKLLLFIFALWIIYCAITPGTVLYHVYDSSDEPPFASEVYRILESSGWKQYHDIAPCPDPERADITVALVSDKDLQFFHKKKQEYYADGTPIRFSVTTQGPNSKPRCLINLNNWRSGVPRSGLTREQYRKYVIEHEFGHGLGYHHQPCNANTATKKGDSFVCPVMYQSTRGCPAPYKCGYEVTKHDTTNLIPERYLRF